MVEEKTDDKDNTLDQFLSFLSHIFHLFSWTWCNRNTCNTSKFLSLIDASMVIPTIPINTLDGEDTDAQRECWKMNFELHGNVIHQNVRLWKTNLMVPKSTIFCQWLRRNPTTKITFLINFRHSNTYWTRKKLCGTVMNVVRETSEFYLITIAQCIWQRIKCHFDFFPKLV